MQKQALLSEINEIKQDIFKQKEQSNDNLKLLGELLKHLRTSKSMALLMICRQIKKLEVENNVVYIDSDDIQIQQLSTNDKYKLELDLFFKQKGLSYKIVETHKEISKIDILNNLLGGKLIIE